MLYIKKLPIYIIITSILFNNNIFAYDSLGNLEADTTIKSVGTTPTTPKGLAGIFNKCAFYGTQIASLLPTNPESFEAELKKLDNVKNNFCLNFVDKHSSPDTTDDTGAEAKLKNQANIFIKSFRKGSIESICNNNQIKRRINYEIYNNELCGLIYISKIRHKTWEEAFRFCYNLNKFGSDSWSLLTTRHYATNPNLRIFLFKYAMQDYDKYDKFIKGSLSLVINNNDKNKLEYILNNFNDLNKKLAPTSRGMKKVYDIQIQNKNLVNTSLSSIFYKYQPDFGQNGGTKINNTAINIENNKALNFIQKLSYPNFAKKYSRFIKRYILDDLIKSKGNAFYTFVGVTLNPYLPVDTKVYLPFYQPGILAPLGFAYEYLATLFNIQGTPSFFKDYKNVVGTNTSIKQGYIYNPYEIKDSVKDFSIKSNNLFTPWPQELYYHLIFNDSIIKHNSYRGKAWYSINHNTSYKRNIRTLCINNQYDSSNPTYSGHITTDSSGKAQGYVDLVYWREQLKALNLQHGISITDYKKLHSSQVLFANKDNIDNFNYIVNSKIPEIKIWGKNYEYYEPRFYASSGTNQYIVQDLNFLYYHKDPSSSLAKRVSGNVFLCDWCNINNNKSSFFDAKGSLIK